MKQIKIRNTVLGDGSVKICVPLVCSKRSELEAQITNIIKYNPDVIEVRADWFEYVFEKAKLQETLECIRKFAGDIAVLFTFRTANEGGEKAITWDVYQELLLYVAQSGLVDAIDVEAFFSEANVKEFVAELKNSGAVVIGSNHDFDKTPQTEEIQRRLLAMKEYGMDVSKMAVMPNSPEDVLHLNQATYDTWTRENKDICLITMSMGRLGVSTRLCNGIYGNTMSFASAGKASAPGQVAVEELRSVLTLTQG